MFYYPLHVYVRYVFSFPLTFFSLEFLFLFIFLVFLLVLVFKYFVFFNANVFIIVFFFFLSFLFCHSAKNMGLWKDLQRLFVNISYFVKHSFVDHGTKGVFQSRICIVQLVNEVSWLAMTSSTLWGQLLLPVGWRKREFVWWHAEVNCHTVLTVE